jgi:hypothetical protein
MDKIEIIITNYNGKRITYTLSENSHIDRYFAKTPNGMMYEGDIHFADARGIEVKEEEI